MKRFICLLLVMLTVFTGCSAPSNPTVDEPQATASQSEETTADSEMTTSETTASQTTLEAETTTEPVTSTAPETTTKEVTTEVSTTTTTVATTTETATVTTEKPASTVTDLFKEAKKAKDLDLLPATVLETAYKANGATNPISSNMFFADPTSVVYNGRMYVYGTNDTQQYIHSEGKEHNNYGVIDSLVCYSTADMVNWKFEQVIPVGDIAKWTNLSWAPSIVSREESDGKTHFYLYFADGVGGVGVLTATSPTGPWTDPKGSAVINLDDQRFKSDRICWCFDPGVVIDDNGDAWMAFGGGDPMEEHETGYHTGNCRFGKLSDDMTSIEGDIIVIEAPYHFEANELNYINGTYVLTYCSNWQERKYWDDSLGYPMNQPCNMCYMTSTDPMDPDSWEYKGEYVLNPAAFGYQFSNNHTRLQKFGKNYYLIYQNILLLENMKIYETANGYRSNNVVTLKVDEENVILEPATLKTAGVSQIKYVKPFEVNEAECYKLGAAVSYKNYGDRVVVSTDKEGAYVYVNGLNFKESASSFAVTVKGKGTIDVRLDKVTNESVGCIQFDCDDFSSIWTELDVPVEGKHELLLVFNGEFEFDNWQFK